MKIVPDSLTHVIINFEYCSLGDDNDIVGRGVETTSLYISTYISDVDIFEP